MGALKQDFRIRCANFGSQFGADHDVFSEILSYSSLNHEPGSIELQYNVDHKLIYVDAHTC